MMKDKHQACVAYLKDKASDRILKGLRRKYESLNKVGGVFVLKQPTKDEREFLRGLFKKDYTDQKSISIALEAFERSFDHTRFEGVQLELLLSLYFEQAIVGNVVKKTELLNIRKSFFEDVMASFSNIATFIRETLSLKNGAYKWFVTMYQENPKLLFEIFSNLSDLVNLLNHESQIPLPVAAAQTTKDPHALDDSKPLNKVLIYYLSHAYKVSVPKTAMEKSKLFSDAGILNNTVTRPVMTYGLLSSKNPGWTYFFENNQPLSLTDMNLFNQDLRSVNPSIYCFENPSVFQMFIKTFPNLSAICTGGQINQTVYRILDGLNAYSLYYSGDFDPEGLLIADRLTKRYKNMQIFGYEKENYLKSKSFKKISLPRLNQLNGLENEGLREIKDLLVIYKQAGYQEYIMDALFDFIRSNISHSKK